jgi:hypothetical protein
MASERLRVSGAITMRFCSGRPARVVGAKRLFIRNLLRRES